MQQMLHYISWLRTKSNIKHILESLYCDSSSSACLVVLETEAAASAPVSAAGRASAA